MGMGFASTWLGQVSPLPLLHKTTLTTGPTCLSWSLNLQSNNNFTESSLSFLKTRPNHRNLFLVPLSLSSFLSVLTATIQPGLG